MVHYSGLSTALDAEMRYPDAPFRSKDLFLSFSLSGVLPDEALRSQFSLENAAVLLKVITLL